MACWNWTPDSWLHWRRLPGDDRRTLLLALWLLPAASLGLRLFGFRRVYQTVKRSLPARRAFAPKAAGRQAARLAGLVQRGARRAPGRPACLATSLVLWALLRRQGISAQLRFGVRKPTRAPCAGLDAHAWVEVCGLALDPQPDHWRALGAPRAVGWVATEAEVASP